MIKYSIIAITAILAGLILFLKSGKLKKPASPDIAGVGRLLFPDHHIAFQEFYTSWLTDTQRFLATNQELLSEYDNFDLNRLKPIEVIYIFGESRALTHITDWKGEENEGEIIRFLEGKLNKKPGWVAVEKVRKETPNKRDGVFVIGQFKAIDKDLEALDKKLVFLNLNWDAYVFTVVDREAYTALITDFGKLFHGTGSLQK